MRILIITQYFPPEIGAAAERMASLARFLSERAQVTVLAPVPSYPWGAIQKARQVPWHRHDASDLEVIRTYKLPHRKNFLLRFLGEIQYTLSSLVKAWQLPEPDLVIITSPSFFLGFIGLLLRRVKKIDYVFDVRDHYPDSALDAGVLRNGFLYRLLKRLEQVIYHHAKLVSIVLETWRSELETSARKVVSVPNGVDLERYNSAPVLSADILPPEKLAFLESNFIALYTGNLGRLQDNLTFLRAAKEIATHKNSSIQFVFLGEGLEKE
ncbi:unnamed protein product, partial [marine sediment metagenome]